MTLTIDEIKQANADAGRYWFSPDTIQFFDSRIESEPQRLPDGRTVFLSSEQPPYGPRVFTVRHFDEETSGIRTIGSNLEMSRRQAEEYIEELEEPERKYLDIGDALDNEDSWGGLEGR